MDPDCYYGDHTWRGGICIRCGKRLRCYCGAFVTEDGIEAHLETCRWGWILTTEAENPPTPEVVVL